MKRTLFFLVVVLAAHAAHAQQPDFREEIPMEVYLESLSQISPAAREGADRYLQAFERRCKRVLATRELRRAVAEGNGDPVLMGMIRASHQKDTDALRALEASISCSRHG